MKKTFILILLVSVILVLVMSLANAASVDPDPGNNKPADGNKTVRQEFIWDDTHGTFRKVNVYKVVNTNKQAVRIHKNLSSETDSSIGSPSFYTYWNGKNWVTLEGIIRYRGRDERAEALVTRYDLTNYTYSTSYWGKEVDYQTVYSTYTAPKEPGVKLNITTFPAGEDPGTKPNGKKDPSGVAKAPDSFDPVVEVQLANGWNIKINSHQNESGTEVRVTSPDGNTSYIYGDPQLLQAGLQPGLSTVGNFVLELDGYTLTITTKRTDKGYSVIDQIRITGPNGYEMTFNRNREVKVSGGTK